MIFDPCGMVNSNLGNETKVVSLKNLHSYTSNELRDGGANTHSYTFEEECALVAISTSHNGTAFYDTQTLKAYINNEQIYQNSGDCTFYLANVKKGDVLKMYWQSAGRWTPILSVGAYC